MSGAIIYKMSGSGNDFVFLDGRTATPEEWPAARIREVCDRRRGVGADGLIILDHLGGPAIRMTYWNADGSRVDMCGNAALCSTRLARHLEMVTAEEMVLETDAGNYRTRNVGGSGWAAELAFGDLPMPARAEIPLNAGERAASYGVIGVPHVVLLVDDIEAAPVLARGRELRESDRFQPAGTNVNFVARAGGTDRADWAVRTYERGVEAETLACGTGTVATVLALAGIKEGTVPARIRARSGSILSVSARIE
jgi:diaminopimelate epimerase